MNSKRKRMDPVYIAVLGAIISAVAAFLAGRDQAKESKENKELYKQIAESALKNEAKVEENNKLYIQLDKLTRENAKTLSENDREVINLQQSLILKQELLDKKAATQNEKTDLIKQKAEEITQLAHQLEEAQKELKRFTSESLNYLTGGDSYCYIVFSQPFYGSKELDIYLHHVGKYPLTALRISITRGEAARRESQEAVQVYRFLMRSKYLTEIPVGPVPKLYKPILIGKVSVDPGLRESFEILFYAQNGVWIQGYSYNFNEHHQSKTSYRVSKDGKVLIDETDHKYF